MSFSGARLPFRGNPTLVLGVFDLRNAHTDCSRGLIWQDLENDWYFHVLIPIFTCMYGKNRSPQWHFGNGPDQPPRNIHCSGDGLRQGEKTANVFFNILAARLYRAFMKILGDRGVLFGLADDFNIACPPEVLGEIVVNLPELAMSECGLTTQATKNRVYVQPSTRAAWTLETQTRCPSPTSTFPTDASYRLTNTTLPVRSGLPMTASTSSERPTAPPSSLRNTCKGS